jgi:hypothetical protein
MAGIIRVFTLPDALEIDEISFVEIERTRVYFDDVLAVTYHRARSVAFLIIMGLASVVFGLPGLFAAGKGGELAVLITMMIIASPFLITFLLHLILGTDYITIYGRRTMARMRFRIRKGRAREVYQQLSTRIRAAQATAAAAAAEAAAQAAPPAAPELPPGPPAPPVAAGPDLPPPA